MIVAPSAILQTNVASVWNYCHSNIVPGALSRCLSATTCLRTTVDAAAPGSATSLFLRGGSAALDLSREGYNLGAIATYGTVTALVMNSALKLYTSTKFPPAKTNKDRIFPSLFAFLSALCIISGAYTAILFQLLGIYSKSALGLHNDEGYRAFTAATAVYQTWGFRCFLTSLSSFVGTFLLSLYNKTREEDDVGGFVFVVSVLLTALGAYHIKIILNIATKFIFSPEFSK